MIPKHLHDCMKRLRAIDPVFDAIARHKPRPDNIELLRRHDHGHMDGLVARRSPGGFDIGMDSLLHYFGDQIQNGY